MVSNIPMDVRPSFASFEYFALPGALRLSSHKIAGRNGLYESSRQMMVSRMVVTDTPSICSKRIGCSCFSC